MATVGDPYTRHRRQSFNKLEHSSSTGVQELTKSTSKAICTQIAIPFPSVTGKPDDDYQFLAEDEEAFQISDFFDIPLLISDNGEEDSESESLAVSKLVNSRPSAMNDESTEVAAQVIKKYLREECKDVPESTLGNAQRSTSMVVEEPLKSALIPPSKVDAQPNQHHIKAVLTYASFKSEREKVMRIIVKYISMKITNSFPPQEPKKANPKELTLDEFLMVLVSRLQLSLTNFMKGIIYLFRYMDIIYLLRYLNQSNNFAIYTDMGFGLKKLIVGCFRLALARERIAKDWKRITGLSNVQINAIVKTVIGRLNGKLNIKNAEVLRLKREIYRFIRMVTESV